MNMFESLPDDLCQHVLRFLPAPDILTSLQLNKSWSRLGSSWGFWRDLLLRDSLECQLDSAEQSDTDRDVLATKHAFLVHAHASMLSTVKWYPLQYSRLRNSPTREGHLMCVMGERVIVTGGFCDDQRVHVLNLKPRTADAARQWNAIDCRQGHTFVYGASLTALDEHRAVRFGGFRSGGYSAECNHLHLLTLEEGRNTCKWEMIQAQGLHPACPRAYHSATLIQNRYLVCIGGMQERGSILSESILDTNTWTWLQVPVSDPLINPKPSGRHGHSMIFDAPRNRLVMFGGGNGTDLLRSGVDNTEVWELKFGTNWETNLEQSFPWQWNCIYRDENDDSGVGQPCPLSLAQTLCLGRCHVGAKVSRDSVILACGSGRPSTNGIVGFDLRSDAFVHPRVMGRFPVPRFTAASAVIGMEGWLLIHGGYSVQEGGAVADTILLDLAPGLQRTFDALPTATTQRGRASRAITDDDVLERRTENRRDFMFDESILVSLNERHPMVARMRNNLIPTVIEGRRAAILRSLMANWNHLLSDGEGDEDDEEEVNADSDYDYAMGLPE